MRVVIVTGIFPPDIGGPATHSADLADELTTRGISTTVLTLTDGPSRGAHGGVVRWSRRWPWPARLVAVATWLVRHRSRYDVIYATGLHPAAVAGARLARRPVVVKVVGDPAWERGRRLGLSSESFDEFQDGRPGGLRDRAMRAIRDWSVRRATAVIAPSEYLRAVAEGWQGGRGPGVRVIPNGVRPPSTGGLVPGHSGGHLRAVSVGRLVAHKRVDLIVEAVALTSGVELVVLGEGPEQQALEDLAERRGLHDGATFRGACSHDEVLAELAGAEVLVLASTYEGLPHVVIEALAVGTPVVASAAGGTGEAVMDGVNGRLVEPPTAEAFAEVLAALRDDPVELERLGDGARESGRRWSFDRCADEVAGLLRSLLPPQGRPRIVNLGKGWVDDSPGSLLDHKLEIISRHLDATFVVTGNPGVRKAGGARLVGVPSLRPRVLGSALFYAVGPSLAVFLAAGHPGAAVVCQSPYEAFSALLFRSVVPRRRRPRVVMEIHGDWRSASRLYGSPLRRLIAPLSDAAATWAIGRVDRVRTIGDFTRELVLQAGYRGELDSYIAFSDFGEFLDRSVVALPSERSVAFVGVLEPPKGVDVLLDAWVEVRRSVPGARLRIIGAGSMEAQLRKQAERLGIGGSVEFVGHVTQSRLIEYLDASTCLVLPSRSEGLGRVVLEAMARGRAVVGSRVGGIPELVEDGVTGRLVPPDDPGALASALVAILTNPQAATAMGDKGRRSVEFRDPAAEFESGVSRLAAWVGAAT